MSNKDLPQLAREAAYRAQSEGQSINGIAEAVAVAVLKEVEQYGARRNGAGVVARKLLAQFEAKEV